ncbi:MAG: aminotransferase class V-fold PLP-dependent enzyme [Devosia sp.]
MNLQADVGGPLADPNDFDGLAGLYHVAAAGETPLLKSQKSVFERFMTDKAQGMGGRERIYERVDRARRSVAGLLRVTPDEVGFPLSVAHGMNVLAHSFRNQRGNVVAPQWEYPSLTYPWVTGTELALKLVPTPDYTMDADRFAAEIDDDTRAIVISLVSYYTGERIDLQVYRELADRRGAMLVIDMSHAFGAGDFDVTLADFAFGCGYKWALGTHGAGIAYCNADRQSGWISSDSGWMSAEWVDADRRTGMVTPMRNGTRFELGNPAALNVDMLATGVDYLTRYGLPKIEAHLLSMTEALRTTLNEIGLRLLTPAPSNRRLGIVAFAVTDEAHWRKELESRRILGWVGDKRVRLSPHVYNSPDDIAVVRTAIAEIAAARPETA